MPLQQTHYVGSAAARRPPLQAAAPRQLPALQGRPIKATDKRPLRPAPIPEDMKSEFIEAFWRSGEWHKTTWLGKWIAPGADGSLRLPGAICRLRPDWIVETRTGTGGRALFLASICDLIDHGQVLSIDAYPLTDRPRAPADHLPARRPQRRGHGRAGKGDRRRPDRGPWSSWAVPPATECSRPSATTPRSCPSGPTWWSRTRSWRETRCGRASAPARRSPSSRSSMQAIL